MVDTDSRKGKNSSISHTSPDFSFEQSAMCSGAKFVAGVDEVGRGPLAGPVVVAAVILSPNDLPSGLNDSKKLTPKRRQDLYSQIVQTAFISIAAAPPVLIDKLNIRGATLWAMSQAISGLSQQPDHVLVDGRYIPLCLSMSAQAVVKGDSRSMSIAAASIVAKVARDAMCPNMDIDQPGYCFSSHKGYGTKLHIEAIHRQGPNWHHRKTFSPVSELV